VQWFVGIPLILALALWVLNAIMGVGRSLYQAAEDGLLPRWFEHKNRHGVPDYAMGFNVVCSMILVLLGSPVRIYIISNGGYLLSCTLALRPPAAVGGGADPRRRLRWRMGDAGAGFPHGPAPAAGPRVHRPQQPSPARRRCQRLGRASCPDT
jgi:hypothetical protein